MDLHNDVSSEIDSEKHKQQQQQTSMQEWNDRLGEEHVRRRREREGGKKQIEEREIRHLQWINIHCILVIESIMMDGAITGNPSIAKSQCHAKRNNTE